MDLQDFAKRHHLTVNRDQDGTTIVKGGQGHLFEYSDQELAVLFSPGPAHVRAWGHTRNTLAEAGLTVRQNGDHEGTVSFDPLNKSHVRLALKAVGIRRKRTCSPAQLESLSNARSLRGLKPCTAQMALCFSTAAA